MIAFLCNHCKKPIDMEKKHCVHIKISYGEKAIVNKGQYADGWDADLCEECWNKLCPLVETNTSPTQPRKAVNPMREILFRGKGVVDGEWVEGLPCYNIYHQLCIQPIGEMPCCLIIPETVGQYTGLTDKNGTKIFEEDIILFDYIGKNRGVNGVEAVVFENGKFGVKWGWHKELVCLDGFANTTLEVIGNIHDNPELLKGDGGNA